MRQPMTRHARPCRLRSRASARRAAVPGRSRRRRPVPGIHVFPLRQKDVDGRDICAKTRFALLPGHDEEERQRPQILIDKLGAEFTADPPCQTALPRVTGGKDDGELRGDLEIFGDDLDATARDIGDRAVARQRTRPRLDLRYPSARAPLGLTAIHEHFGPSSLTRHNTPGVAEKRWYLASRTSRNLSIASHFSLPDLCGRDTGRPQQAATGRNGDATTSEIDVIWRPSSVR
jgi:hypothetical protein